MEDDILLRELVIGAEAARKLSVALALAAKALPRAREFGSSRNTRGRESAMEQLKVTLAEGPDPQGRRRSPGFKANLGDPLNPVKGPILPQKPPEVPSG